MIIITDGWLLLQGLHCSRCLYTQHCAGCVLPRDGSEVSLQPGDHLAVQFVDLSDSQMELAPRVVDHRSMELLRPSQPLSLYDCFHAFTERSACRWRTARDKPMIWLITALDRNGHTGPHAREIRLKMTATHRIQIRKCWITGPTELIHGKTDSVTPVLDQLHSTLSEVRVSRVRIRVSVWTRTRFSFSGYLCDAVISHAVL